MNSITPIATDTAEPSRAVPYAVGNFHKGEARMDLTKQWIARPHDQRFLNLTDLRASVALRAEHSIEDRIVTKAVEFITPEIKTMEDIHRLQVGLADGRVVAPTHWSFGQLAGLAGAPSAYLRKLPSPIVADAMSYGLRHLRDVEAIKTYSTGEELLAATGPDYGRIFDRDVVDAVIQFAGQGSASDRWRAPGVLDWRTSLYDPKAEITPDTTSYYASDRDCWIMLCDSENPIEVGKLPNGEPDLLTRGIIITNSEVGKSALKVFAFYFRASCQNRILWGCEEFQELTLRHSKGAPDRFLQEARPALMSFAEGSTKTLIEAVAQAKAAKVAEDQDAALQFLIDRSFSRSKSLAILERGEQEEGRAPRSAWDMAQAITADARTINYTDERIDQERIAKTILDKVA